MAKPREEFSLKEMKGLLPSEIAEHVPDSIPTQLPAELAGLGGGLGGGGGGGGDGQYSVFKRFVKNCGAYNAINGIELPVFLNAPLDWKFYQSSITLVLFSLFLQVIFEF